MNAPMLQGSELNQIDKRFEEVWLLGQPPLNNYLHFVKELVIGGSSMARRALVDEWRAANDYYGELEETEAGLADQAGYAALDPAMLALADEVRADARFKRSFEALPNGFAMVELERLMVGHPYVSKHHTDRLAARVGALSGPEDLFRFCLPLDRNEAPVHVRKSGPRSFMFWSDSSDFRFQEAALLQPEQLQGFEPMGALGGVVGVMTGYGSNFLNVIRSDSRMLLHNGHHRAYTLIEAGITHAPCIVQTVTRLDELKLVAARHVSEDPAFYFAAKRPPLLKDFFDPRIRKVHRVHGMANIVEVTIEIKEQKKTRDFSAATRICQNG